MNTQSIPTSWSDPEVKKQMTAVKYRKEQEYTAHEAIRNCPSKAYALELYAGTGGLTEIYRRHFAAVVTNDLNKEAKTNYNLSAMDFIHIVLADASAPKIDLIDFDCYGCPALEIQEFFKVRRNRDAPFVLRFSDGLGLWMKRNKNQEVIRKRYLITDELDMTRIWTRHPDLIDAFLKRIAGWNGMTATKLVSVQTKFKNYVLGAYRFDLIV